MKTIVLVGMMGAGKSVIGRKLSQRLSCEYIDLDEKIEKSEGIAISDIFEKYGEKYFRNCEYIALRRFFTPENVVISLGGGAFENQEIRDILIKNSDIVYLEASPETIFQRIKDDKSRPLLKNNMSVEKISEIIGKRNKNYKLATYTVKTDNKNIEDIVLEIIKCVC